MIDDLKYNEFVERLAVAQEVALKTRESQIFDLRYGFSNEEPLSLARIGERFDLSRERIRQLLNRAHRKIRGRGRRKIRKAEYDDPCAQLILYLEETIRPSQPGHIDRLTSFVLNELSHLPTRAHALRLVTCLIYPSKKVSVSCEKEAWQRIKELRHARCREYKLRKAREKFDGLLSYVIWPRQVIPLSVEQVQNMRRKRNVFEDNERISGCYFSHKLNREIQYESQSEFDFLLRLEELKTIPFYQEQPFAVPSSHGGQVHNYYPDIFFLLEDGRGVVVEIKPAFEMALHKNLRKWSALREFCKERGLGLLVTDGRCTIQQVMQWDINRDFADEILSALEVGPLSWDEYRGIKDKHDVTSRDFLALVLCKRLVWELSPFRLSKS